MTTADSINEQVHRAAAAFRARFGRPPRFGAVAPGRVNLIGEHTDYNGGFVLPMAIERQTVIVADRAPTPGTSRVVRVASSAKASEMASFDVNNKISRGEPAWSNYVRGVVAGCFTAGLDPGGFDCLIDSTIPLGGGLSSSAALEVATATLIEAMAGRTLGLIEKVKLCQKAEHDFAGTPCGIMDQMIAARGEAGHAMLLDCRSLEARMVPLTDPGVTVLIVNSNVKHELVSGEYAQRRAQCEAAAKGLGVKSLRDVTMEQLRAAERGMDAVVFRRARHVVGEIARTLEAASAAEAGDWATFGGLMFESHESLRTDFEVSCEELDILVQAAREIGAGRGVWGSRMTGGGFGGCTVNLVRADAVDHVADHIAREYREKTGIEATIFATRPTAGARGVQV